MNQEIKMAIIDLKEQEMNMHYHMTYLTYLMDCMELYMIAVKKSGVIL